MRPVHAALLALAVPCLSACEPAGGRYIVAANSAAMVVVEQLVVNGASASALTTYVSPDDKPHPVTGKAPIVQIQHFHEFDCAAGKMASRGQRFILQDGEIIDLPAPRLEWSRPAGHSIGGSIVRVACDPAFARTKSTRNSFRSVTRHYQRLMRERSNRAS